MTVNELCNCEHFAAVVIPDGEREIEGVYIGDLLSWVMGKAKSGDAWITIMSNINVLAVATLTDCACVVLAEGVELPPDIKEAAQTKGINVLSSELPAYAIVLRLGELIKK